MMKLATSTSCHLPSFLLGGGPTLTAGRSGRALLAARLPHKAGPATLGVILSNGGEMSQQK